MGVERYISLSKAIKTMTCEQLDITFNDCLNILHEIQDRRLELLGRGEKS